MMRFQHTLAPVLAALLLLPSAARLVGAQELDLTARLSRTSAAIEELLGLEQRITRGERDAVARLLAATEAPAADAAAYDATIVALRSDVGRLHERLDSYASGELTEAQALAAARGLASEERAALLQLASSAPDSAGQAASEGERAPSSAASGRAFEADPAYSADRVRQAQLLLRAGRALEAIAVLEPLHTQGAASPAEVRYWLARAHDKAALSTDALALYEALIADAGAGRWAERARIDCEFLRVKLELSGAQAGGGK